MASKIKEVFNKWVSTKAKLLEFKFQTIPSFKFIYPSSLNLNSSYEPFSTFVAPHWMPDVGYPVNQ